MSVGFSYFDDKDFVLKVNNKFSTLRSNTVKCGDDLNVHECPYGTKYIQSFLFVLLNTVYKGFGLSLVLLVDLKTSSLCYTYVIYRHRTMTIV